LAEQTPKTKKMLVLVPGALVFIIAIIVLYFQFFRFDQYYVIFNNIQYLQVGADVIVDEVQVGKVKKLGFLSDNSGKILVELKIENDINLPDHSIARIVKNGIAEYKVIEIELTASMNYYKSGDTLIAQDFFLNIDSLVNLSNSVNNMVSDNPFTSLSIDEIVYSVQLIASVNEIPLIPENFKGLKEVRIYTENDIYKYVYGNKKSLSEIKDLKLQLQNMGYNDAFIVVFRNGKRISLSELH